MSKQRLQELEAQYNACIHQQEAAKNTNQGVINEINQLKSQAQKIRDDDKKACWALCIYSSNLTTIKNTNDKITDDINIERTILNKLTSMLSQYNEYIPPVVNQININENSTNVEQVGEIAAFIERANG